jgi:imidazoleglycerol-phosphate dehydratase
MATEQDTALARRRAERERVTRETKVRVAIDLDGRGDARVSTGIGFFDHMLAQLARHGLFDLDVSCQGDLEIDGHHTVEDVAITIGETLAEALGDKAGIVRYGHAYVPMDDALVRAVVDLSGRPYLVYRVENTRERIGGFDVELAEHFWLSLATAARCNLHVELLYGRNQHHILEAGFKAVARALSVAVRRDPRVAGVPSTKGTL